MENKTDFKNYFNTNFSSAKKKKFTIVLGTGFLNQLTNQNRSAVLNNYLTSWDSLLLDLNSQITFSSNPILNFEAIILEETLKQNEKSADEIEKKIIQKIIDKIKLAQNSLLENVNYNFPFGLFNPNFISDVICLNFDLIPELLLTQNNIPKVKFIQKKTNLTNSSPIASTRYRVINNINFWHPHGDIDNSNSLILGLRKYSLHLKKIETLRKRSKTHQKETNYIKSWYDALTHNPIIILGAEISDSEWGIWNAIVNRERNFAKGLNHNYYRNPIFQMRTSENNKCQRLSSNRIWFNPLFDETLSFDDQWKELELLLEKNK